MRTAVRIAMWIAGILGVIIGLLYAFVFDVWTVPGDDPAMTASIAPTLAAGDIVLISRHAGAERDLLLRCADPDAPGRFVIAREAAKSGEEVQVIGDTVKIDGTTPSTTACIDSRTVSVESPTTHETVDLSCQRTDSGGAAHEFLRANERSDDDTKETVDPGHIYLLSDDLHFHQDSRDYGQINPATCQHIVFRLESATGIGDRNRRFTLLW